MQFDLKSSSDNCNRGITEKNYSTQKPRPFSAWPKMELSGRIFIKEIGSEFSLRSPFEALETLLRFRFETFGQKTKNFFSKIYLYLFLGPLQSGKCHFPRKLNWSHLEISSRCRTSVLFSFQKTFFLEREHSRSRTTFQQKRFPL